MGRLVGSPFVFSFEPVKTKTLRVVFKRFRGNPRLRDVTFSAAALVDSLADKQLGRMWQSPVPPADYYEWALQAPAKNGTTIPKNAVKILWRNPAGDTESGTVRATFGNKNGEGKIDVPLNKNTPPAVLDFSAPADGDYIVARVGMATTGAKCSPTPPHATGLEVDKLSARHTAAHFDAFIGKFIERFPDAERKGALKHITLDSYEVGPQNWTDDFPALFRAKYGYDPLPWLASLNGLVVGTRDQTDRFLWDWRRLVADLIAKNYVGGLTAAANRHGIKTWLENYGHWGFPAESLQYGGAADEIGGEYWWGGAGALGGVEVRLASSCGHTYGKRRVSAEAFTSGGNFNQTPANLKTRADWSFANGINHLVLHVTVHQPYKAFPGIVPWFGADFNRYSTWFKDYGKGFTDYIRRASYLLQQDNHGADVAYFFGEDTPRMNGKQIPALPAGYDFDYINAEVLLNKAFVRDGKLTLRHGQTYRVLALPPTKTMTSQLARKLAQFVKEGLVLVVAGDAPERSPSLQNYPNADKVVQTVAKELWGENAGTGSGKENSKEKFVRAVGKGRVFGNYSLTEVFAEIGVGKDIAGIPNSILWTHRAGKDSDIYFLSNQSGTPVVFDAEFRVAGARPELWNAETGEVTDLARFTAKEKTTVVPLALDGNGSAFVVFNKKKPVAPAAQVVSIEFPANVSPAAAVTPSVYLARAGEDEPHGALRVRATAAGTYKLRTADGKTHTQTLARNPLTLNFTGAWEVAFRHPKMNTAGAGADSFEPVYEEQRVRFDSLRDWTTHSDPRIKFFSGTAVYKKKFIWPETNIAGRHGAVLELGDLSQIARVVVNGTDLGVVWKAPWKIDIGRALLGGENTLEIHVANLWNNRFNGDAAEAPEPGSRGWPEWVVNNSERPNKNRVTHTSSPRGRKGGRLEKSGLFGPVVLKEYITLGDGIAESKKDGFSLIWADEFNTAGTQLPDPKNWGYEHGYSIRNRELQFYTRERLENTRVTGGRLIIEAKPEPFGKIVNGKPQADYTSASVVTHGKQLALHYGRLEIRAKLPSGPGIWPALWMMGTDIGKVGWPRCGEIDIMEHVWSSPGTVYVTYHFGDNTPVTDKQGNPVIDEKTGKQKIRTHKSSPSSGIADIPWDGFHVYRLDWTPDELAVFYDDVLIHRYRRDPAGNPLHWPFNKPHYLLMNIALGGDWGGPPNRFTRWPAQMEIDYVRAWKKE